MGTITDTAAFIRGPLTLSEFTRARHAQETSRLYMIPWTAWRVHDAMHTNLPAVGASGDLGLVGGAFGSASPSLQTEDMGGTTITEYARCQFCLPPEYDDGETVSVRFRAGMLNTVTDTTATIDLECHESDGEAGGGGDLCSTGAQDIKNLVLAEKTFVITPTTLIRGAWLDLRVALALVDSANAGEMEGIIGQAYVMLDIRG